MLVDKIFVLGIALSFDAFGVAIGIGCGKKLNLKEVISIMFSFAFFQYFFVFLGGILGNFVNSNIFNISGLISGMIIIVLGFLYIKEGFEDEGECLYYELSFWKYLLLGISVSIDALGVGFSVLYKYSVYVLLNNSIIVGSITFLLTFLSLVIVKYIKRFKLLEECSVYIGGIILIIFGLKMIF